MHQRENNLIKENIKQPATSNVSSKRQENLKPRGMFDKIVQLKKATQYIPLFFYQHLLNIFWIAYYPCQKIHIEWTQVHAIIQWQQNCCLNKWKSVMCKSFHQKNVLQMNLYLHKWKYNSSFKSQFNETLLNNYYCMKSAQ